VRENYETTYHKKEVRQLLGFFSYFRTYIKNFAEIAHPLTELTKKDVPNQTPWALVHQRAFDALKNHLCAATNLHVIQFGQPCDILVDASGISVGSCLIQWDENGMEKPIAFASCKLTPTQTMWSTIEREAYAVIFALKSFETLCLVLRVVSCQITTLCYI